MTKIKGDKNSKTLFIKERAPDEVLARLPEFIRLDGLLPNLVYTLGLKNA